MSWSKTPPSEPGFYWIRHVPPAARWEVDPSPAHFEPGRDESWEFMGGDQTARSVELLGQYEFWSERIEPPKEQAK